MLKLYVEKDFDIINLSIMFAENGFNAIIEKDCIKIDDPLTPAVAKQITEHLEITRIVNFYDDGNVKKQAVEPEKIQEKTDEHVSNSESNFGKVTFTPAQASPKFPIVNSGEIYLCDLGMEYFSGELAKPRPVVIIQNDIANKHSPATIVLPLTTTEKKFLYPTQKLITRDARDYLEYWLQDGKNSIILGEQIRVVSKMKLIKKLGRLKPHVVDDLQALVFNALCFKTRERIVEKIVERPVEKIVEKKVVRTVVKEVPVKSNSEEELKKVQIELLENTNIKDLLEIANSGKSLEEKVDSYLNLFGFTPSQNLNYLKEAILLFAKDSNLTVKTLTEKISKGEEAVSAEEIERHLVGIVKGNFKMKKSPTMAFIRLITSLLS